MSGAFHSSLVAAAVASIQEVLRQSRMQAPRLPVLANTTAEPYPVEAAAARGLLGKHLACPVRFQETIERLAEMGVRTFVEVGPGAVLTGLVRDCLPGQDCLAASLDRKGQPGLTALWHALGQLAVQDVTLRWASLWRDYPELQPPQAVPGHAVAICGASKAFRAKDVLPRAEGSSRVQPAMP